MAVSSPGRIVLANLTGDVESTLLTSALTSDARGLAMDLEDGVLFFAGSENSSSVFKPDEYIQSMIFDPVERKLYWTDSNLRAIFWSPVATDPQAPLQGARVLLKFETDQPQGLALDHCRRILFWSNSNAWSPSIERVSLQDTSLSPGKIVDSNLFQPLGLVVDPAGQGRLYWGHDLQLYSGNHHKPFSLAKVGDMLFWSDWTHSAVWSINISIPKGQRKVQKVLHFNKENPYSVLAYPSPDVCIKVDDLAPLEVTTPSTTVITTPEVTTEFVPATSSFKLASHQFPRRCASAPRATLAQGVSKTCASTTACTEERAPRECRPSAIVLLDARGRDVNWTCVTASASMVALVRRSRNDISKQLCTGDAMSSEQSNFYYIVFSLVAVCLTLLIVVGALTGRVVVLSRRPRIRRRVVVSRKEMSVPKGHSGEPGSSRRGVQHGDTCEITIENCCNMNICETPCFEPPVRSPGKLSKKDEKKNLLANMEEPDSQ
ncbi:hypothetical protein B566_EDAN005942 [Ephemera danica]|nr:hypothetical protein B566_EDAN005942 [Ephemera danica]